MSRHSPATASLAPPRSLVVARRDTLAGQLAGRLARTTGRGRESGRGTEGCQSQMGRSHSQISDRSPPLSLHNPVSPRRGLVFPCLSPTRPPRHPSLLPF
ncbi:hypothetical protein EVG20_g11492 [Dentipellis fragilis]|uniref:Uncharacterized protein n=1 Tax=Dentipellis fragilis TaxID=205917 RepID=A0A4Y9XK05_9AGAM|nr:hypothetical protein EVG20_g11492 [Dentipellis fragilis]